jgi:sulfur carrier protein
MQVLVNGEPQPLAAGATVATIVEALPDAPRGRGRGLAVALDGEVVPRGQWAATPLRDGARVEIVVAVQGG